jgi:ribosomal protein S18 acetylase RimI-like enzyme
MHALDRPVWNGLHGPQSSLAVGGDPAVRIDPGYGPFAAARDDGDEAQAALARFTAPGDEIWIIEPDAWSAPAGLQVAAVPELVQMIGDGSGEMDEDVILLGEGDLADMTALALATRPGPWGPKTHLYGAFYGIRIDGRLAAMAGERLRPAVGWAEVSAVSTWPEFRGQGLAARLIRHVVAGFAARGDRPFLHSYADNAGVIALYEKLGFRTRAKMVATRLIRD